MNDLPPIPPYSESKDPPPVPVLPGTPRPMTANDTNMGMLCHLAALSGLLLPVPGGSILGPLVIWLMEKDKSAYVDYHGKESLNFHITMAIFIAVCCVLFFLIVPLLVAVGLGIFSLVMSVVGAVKASNGEYYRYPFAIRFLK